jgi:hypothetical protein
MRKLFSQQNGFFVRNIINIGIFAVPQGDKLRNNLTKSITKPNINFLGGSF